MGKETSFNVGRGVQIFLPSMTRVWGIVDHSTYVWERWKERNSERKMWRGRKWEKERIGEWTTIDKCILLAYHLYAWAFALPGSLTPLRRAFNVRLLREIEWKSFLVDLTVAVRFNRSFHFKPYPSYQPLLSRPWLWIDFSPLKKVHKYMFVEGGESSSVTTQESNTFFLYTKKNIWRG